MLPFVPPIRLLPPRLGSPAPGRCAPPFPGAPWRQWVLPLPVFPDMPPRRWAQLFPFAPPVAVDAFVAVFPDGPPRRWERMIPAMRGGPFNRRLTPPRLRPW